MYGEYLRRKKKGDSEDKCSTKDPGQQSKEREIENGVY
jgi:hypothetical protein